MLKSCFCSILFISSPSCLLQMPPPPSPPVLSHQQREGAFYKQQQHQTAECSTAALSSTKNQIPPFPWLCRQLTPCPALLLLPLCPLCPLSVPPKGILHSNRIFWGVDSELSVIQASNSRLRIASQCSCISTFLGEKYIYI